MPSPKLSLPSCPSCRRRLLRSFGFISTRSYTKSSVAPKFNIALKHIRQSPGLYEQNCIDRKYESLSRNSWRILELHEQLKESVQEARPLREKLNTLHAQLPRSKDKDDLLEQAKQLQPRISAFDQTQRRYEKEIQELAEALPNLSSGHTPVGDEPSVIGTFNEHPAYTSPDRIWRSHSHIGSELDLLDFEGSATTSGWGWYFLKNEAAMMEQALIQYALSVAMRRGWQIVSPPSLVYGHIADACGFQPRDKNKEQQTYAIQQSEKDRAKPQIVLAGTAEIPLAGMKANTTLSEADLPLKVVGVSRAYRAEAGARGIETKGLYRVHEFTKVEMFAWTLPDLPAKASSETDMFASGMISQSDALFDEILDMQIEILKSLGLHCRILEMPTHDLGASASRKRDIEAYFPSRVSQNKAEEEQGWGELTSASTCTDYQTRRLATRLKLNKREGMPTAGFPWTLNGTAMAVPRVLACILENHWDEDRGVVVIPEVLRPWMGGMDVIGRKRQEAMEGKMSL